MDTLIITAENKKILDSGFSSAFGRNPERYFSAPGRTEIGGNHTDHQRGRVLAAAVNLDIRAAVALNGSNVIRVLSEGYSLCEVNTNEIKPIKCEENTTTALIRGIVSKFTELGCKVSGFDAYCISSVLSGSGLSSSAAFEVLIGTIINNLFFNSKLSQPEIAIIGKYSENVFFGKPCGLMDQTASAVGNLITIDFFDKDKPEIKSVNFDFSACGHALCIIDTHSSHADLTDDYAAITNELKAICSHFGKDVLTEIAESDFYSSLSELRKNYGDRAVLRAIHFYKENARVPKQVSALEHGDFNEFLRLIKESGFSSFMYLQNVIPHTQTEHQDVAFTLALCDHLLDGKGAFRVHGGGFSGTVQAFVPFDILDGFVAGIDSVLGENSCHVLSIRPQGGIECEVE